MPNIYIKNAKNKMKKAIRAKKKKNTEKDTNDTYTENVPIRVPTHEEAVEAAVKAAHIHLKGYI